MDDLLAQFLADGEKLMVNVPLDFFENYTSEESKAPNGIHIVWFIACCRANDLLSPEFAGAIADYLKSPVQATLSFRDFCDQYTGGSLRPEHLSDRCPEFARRYYGTGWTHRYLVDLEMLFPAVEAFDQLVDSPGNLEAANRMLLQRWAEFRGE